MTFWDFYSNFLLYNSFVYAKMYGKINCRIDKKRGEKRGEEIGPVCNSIGLIFFDGDEGDPSLISHSLNQYIYTFRYIKQGGISLGPGFR